MQLLLVDLDLCCLLFFSGRQMDHPEWNAGLLQKLALLFDLERVCLAPAGMPARRMSPQEKAGV